MFARHHKSGRHWHHSIRKRLVALFLLLALCSSAVFLFGMQRVVKSGWQAWAQPLVADYVDRLAADVLPAGARPPDLARARAIAEQLPVALRVEGPAVPGGVWDSHPDAWRSRFRAGPDGDGIDAVERWGLVRSRDDGHRVSFRLRAAPDAMRPRLFGWITLGALLLLTAAAWFAVRRTLAPLASIGAGVEAYGQGRFDTPIPVRRRDELGELAERINGMAANLSGMLDAKRALLLAISHELRSPLTRARVNAELLPDGTERGALLRDLGEMRELITALLEGERLAQGHAALQPQPLDLAALVHDVVATQFERQALTLDLRPPAQPVAADPMRLRLLLRNLVDNALRHSAAGAAPPVVFLRVDGAQVVLGVRDHGQGHELDDAQLAQLGEAFYRPDSARTRAGGGVGLGLYLCRLVAQAHGGTLRIRRAHPGLEIAAAWPMKQTPG